MRTKEQNRVRMAAWRAAHPERARQLLRESNARRPKLTERTSERHGLTGTPEYIAWTNAKQRVTNPDRRDWPNYGGRGIRMAEEWLRSFVTFLAHVGPRPAGLTLDRIDVDGHYEPGNVRWATRAQQTANRRVSAV